MKILTWGLLTVSLYELFICETNGKYWIENGIGELGDERNCSGGFLYQGSRIQVQIQIQI